MSTLKNKSGLITLALLVITAGALMIVFQTNLLPSAIKPLLFSWQALLISIGAVSLFWSNRHIHPLNRGFILIIVGAVFLLPKIPVRGFEVFQENGRALCWALLLIFMGIVILCQVIFGKRNGRSFFVKLQASTRSHANEDGYLERNYVFGGGEERFDTLFKGGEINCVFGGLELDLSHAQLAEGVHTLEINVVFGGIELFVPAHWNIEIKPSCVFGSFEDKRHPAPFDMEENKKVLILVSAVFGGGEIRTR